MKTFFVAVVCLAACAFAFYEIIGLIKDIKKRKAKKDSKSDKEVPKK